MDLQKFIETQELSTFPIGLGGCRNMNNFFDSCDYDLMVFDENHLMMKLFHLYYLTHRPFDYKYQKTSSI